MLNKKFLPTCQTNRVPENLEEAKFCQKKQTDMLDSENIEFYQDIEDSDVEDEGSNELKIRISDSSSNNNVGRGE